MAWADSRASSLFRFSTKNYSLRGKSDWIALNGNSAGKGTCRLMSGERSQPKNPPRPGGGRRRCFQEDPAEGAAGGEKIAFWFSLHEREAQTILHIFTELSNDKNTKASDYTRNSHETRSCYNACTRYIYPVLEARDSNCFSLNTTLRDTSEK